VYDTIVTPLSIDFSTGDVITPSAVQYEFSGIFDDELRIHLWGYNIETVMAEKLETVLSRGIFNTRPRDFYDIFILATTQKYDKVLLKEALSATVEHRGSTEKIADTDTILNTIAESDDLLGMWKKYQKKFTYAKDISYEDIIGVIRDLFQ
jgi:predicted nucleotidyltransferase component of viral defense system